MNEDTKKDYSVIVAKKSEKLVTALYLVTDLIEDNEPIKHSLRRNAVTLLSSMNSLSQLEVKDRILNIKLSLRSVTEILSLLHVSLTAGLVSQMNGELLTEGFRALQIVLEKRQPIFSKEMLLVENEQELENEGAHGIAITGTSYDALTPLSIARLHESKEELRKNQEALRQSHLLHKLEQPQKEQNVDVAIKDKKENKKDILQNQLSTHHLLMEHAVRPVPTVASSFQMKKLSRREQILTLFVKGVDVSIKDIAARIRGCSEKTIQRELNALLYDNVIERIGEKRWSRYVLR